MTIAAAGRIRPVLIDRIVSRGVGVSVALVGFGVLLIALLAQVSIPLPFSPVPITGQTLGVMLVGAAFGANLGAITLLSYAVIGVIGVPVFSDFSGGLHTVTTPTFGYIVGFIAAAYIIGWLSERQWDRTPIRAIIAFGVASAVPFLTGVPYLAFALSASGSPVDAGQAIQLGLIPFILPGIVKWALMAALLPAAHAVLTRISKRRTQG